MSTKQLDRPLAVAAISERTIPRERDEERHPSVRPELWQDHVTFARTKDPEVLCRLVEEYQRYARSLAGRMARGNEPREDLDQMAFEALIVALHRFDPERGIPFPAFATPTILGALRRHFRDHGWLVRVSRRVHELATTQRDVTDRLTTVLGRTPTSDEVAERMGVSIEDLCDLREALHARETRSIDAVTGDQSTLQDRMGAGDPALDRAEDRIALRDAMAELDPDDRRLVCLYFLEDRSQSDIADVIGVSQMQVSRLLRSAINRLRSAAMAV